VSQHKQERGYSHSGTLSRQIYKSKIKENQSWKRGVSSLTQEAVTSNSSCKISQEEDISEVAPATADSIDSCNASMTICDHKQSESVDPQITDVIITETSLVTLNIQSASDNDDDKEKPDAIMIDEGSSDADYETVNSSSPCGDPNISKLPVLSVHSLNQEETSNAVCLDSPVKEKSIPITLKDKPIKVTCQFTMGDPTKQQQVHCLEKDGIIYFISWMNKQVRCRRIFKLGAQHDTVITYDPSTNTYSPKQFICRRANVTYAFGILNFKNRILLVAGDNLKFLDGSVYLYQLVECKKHQRAFGYKWNEMAKSVRSCSPVVASPAHAVCTTTDDCILVCQLTNNSDCTLKALSINIYNEACTEEGTKWKVISLNLPTPLLNENGHLTSGTVHQKKLYLSIKTCQGFGVMEVSVATLDGLDGSTDLVPNTVAFHTVMEEPSLMQYFLFECSDKLLASSVNKHASCCIGSVTITNSSVKQTTPFVHQCDLDDNVQLHSVISVPKYAMLILVYYSPQHQNIILNNIGTSVFQ